MSRMYKERKKSINFYVGCKHSCLYCIPSFQRQMKRQGKRCQLCYYYVPHAHLERLKKAPPRTFGAEFIFFPSSSDWAFIPKEVGDEAIAYMEHYSDRRFLCQTKDSSCFYRWSFPENAILAITLETNRAELTRAISKAPIPEFRVLQFKDYPHASKIVTIEPILDFDEETLVGWMKVIKPKPVIYVGYDNHGCRLEEPSKTKTGALIERLEEEGFEVRCKTIRKAWWEK